jgi:hypothetical protein
MCDWEHLLCFRSECDRTLLAGEEGDHEAELEEQQALGGSAERDDRVEEYDMELLAGAEGDGRVPECDRTLLAGEEGDHEAELEELQALGLGSAPPVRDLTLLEDVEAEVSVREAAEERVMKVCQEYGEDISHGDLLTVAMQENAKVIMAGSGCLGGMPGRDAAGHQEKR